MNSSETVTPAPPALPAPPEAEPEAEPKAERFSVSTSVDAATHSALVAFADDEDRAITEAVRFLLRSALGLPARFSF